eukprot:TRINITY_DN21471_c0_g1_i1.p1 TRINITY_DN21471_c0_g1~~TRINITY_DN21471_c0_g1_i1.p1  ORF type:complete len:569 (-),score=112.20 TRINITY_DN21471_c0_g1_i1:381-2087(-)
MAGARCLGDPIEYLNLTANASSIVCIVVSNDCYTESLTRVGFHALHHAGDYSMDAWQSCQWAPTVSLIVIMARVDSDASALVQELCEAVTGNDLAPATMVTLLPQPHIDELSQQTLELEKDLLQKGADDVVVLLHGEKLTSHRTHMITMRTELLAERTRMWTDEIVGQVEQQARNALKNASKKFLWSMPGSTLRSIPPLDAAVHEWLAPPGGTGAVGGVSSFTFLATLGSGSFGSVYRAQHPEHGIVAVKRIEKKAVKNASFLFALDREFCIMLNLPRHPNIVSASMALHGNEALYVCTDYAGRYNLHEYVVGMVKRDKVKSLSPDVSLKYLRQEATAVGYLHMSKICHRDIKPNNFVVSDDGSTVRLTDYGLAMQLCSEMQVVTETCGSLPFCAPEVLRNAFEKRPYNGFVADIWSLGTNFLELLLGPWSVERMLRWKPQAPQEISQKVADIEGLEEQASELKLPVPENVRAAVLNMLHVEPCNRWSMRQLCGPEGLAIQDPAFSGLTPARPKNGPPSIRRPSSGATRLVQGYVRHPGPDPAPMAPSLQAVLQHADVAAGPSQGTSS